LRIADNIAFAHRVSRSLKKEAPYQDEGKEARTSAERPKSIPVNQ
jgi:hypothetical protein